MSIGIPTVLHHMFISSFNLLCYLLLVVTLHFKHVEAQTLEFHNTGTFQNAFKSARKEIWIHMLEDAT